MQDPKKIQSSGASVESVFTVTRDALEYAVGHVIGPGATTMTERLETNWLQPNGKGKQFMDVRRCRL